MKKLLILLTLFYNFAFAQDQDKDLSGISFLNKAENKYLLTNGISITGSPTTIASLQNSVNSFYITSPASSPFAHLISGQKIEDFSGLGNISSVTPLNIQRVTGTYPLESGGVILNLNEGPFTSSVFTGFTKISEVNYRAPDQISSFNFSDPVLTSDDGSSFVIRATTVSSSISSAYSAAPGNGAMVIERGVYESNWKGSDNYSYAVLSAPSTLQPVSMQLYTSANGVLGNSLGTYSINTGQGNVFSFSTTSSSEATIGWDDSPGTKITLSAENIVSRATFLQHSPFISTSTIAVLTNSSPSIQLGDGTQAYFGSSNAGRTGIVIENFNFSHGEPGITINNGINSNWIGTITGQINSDLYLSGTLMLQSESPGGILLSAASSSYADAGSIRFAIGSTEVARISENSVLIGTKSETACAILEIESRTQGVLLPRMTSDEMFNIQNPKKGLFLFNTSLDAPCIFNGTDWREIVTKKIKHKNLRRKSTFQRI